MTLLITGGAGYIGSHVAQQLIAQHENILIYDNLSTGSSAALWPEAQFFHADLADSAALVADNRKIRATLNWTPRYNDLDLMISHALHWERSLHLQQVAA